MKAKVLEKVGAAQIILNNELTKENLNEAISNIISNNKIQEMEKMALSQAKYDAEDIIYEEIKKLVKQIYSWYTQQETLNIY